MAYFLIYSKEYIKRSENMHYDTMNFLLFFLIYGFLGFLLETVFRSFANRKLYISRGFLTKGFCPLYGICGVLIIEIFNLCELTLHNPLYALIGATLGSIAAVTLLEYITGRVLDRVFHCKLWDYSQYPFNLHSYICLEFSLLWGIVALLLVNYLHPVMELFLYAIPYNIRAAATIMILSIVFVNASYNMRKMLNGGGHSLRRI
jgi:uncharacterized membrane protein